MRNLLRFLYQFRVFGFFLFLEGASLWLIIANNRYYNTHYINTSNQVSGGIIDFTDNSRKYFSLSEINSQLLDENAFLREQMLRLPGLSHSDSIQSQYLIIPSQVISNTFRKSANFITINTGSIDGIRPEMGVVSDHGIVGVVKSVSQNYATVISLLHQNLMVSSKLKNQGTLCTTQWDGISPLYSSLKYIPGHIEIQIGDTVVTSGYNAVFPKGINIGTIESFDRPRESPFYEARIRLSEDFTSLNFVYIVENQDKEELDSLIQNLE